MGVEQEQPQQVLDHMLDFLCTEQEYVNNFILVGDIEDEQIEFETLAAIFPAREPNGNPSYIAVSQSETVTVPEMHSAILHVEIPEVEALQDITDDSHLRNLFEEACRRKGWPTMMIAFGQTIPSGERVALLVTIAGISPQTALTAMQWQSRNRLARFN